MREVAKGFLHHISRLAVTVAMFLPGNPALARFGALPLDMVVSGSAVVADATILKARVAEYGYRDYADTCGFVYEARVAESFKGQTSRIFTFASNLSMAPGSRHLLFLRNYDGDFPSDVSIGFEDPEDPGFGEGVEKARDRCLADLPRLKSSYLHDGEFVRSDDLLSQAVSISRWIALIPGLVPVATRAPEELKPQEVEWSMLRAWLLRNVADIVDSALAGDSCNATCVAAALRETSVVLQRNLQAAGREFANQAGSAVALDAVQRQWHDFVAADCTAVAAVNDRPGQPVQSCRLWLTQARARELWLQRLIFQTPASIETCQDACMDEDLKSATESVQHRLREIRTKRASAADLADHAQRSWEGYLDVNCRSFGSGRAAHPSALATATCRHRLTEERNRELWSVYRAVGE
jgi:uncharacterized protein YecT (DUF1311 family)